MLRPRQSVTYSPFLRSGTNVYPASLSTTAKTAHCPLFTVHCLYDVSAFATSTTVASPISNTIPSTVSLR
jgi:hypothetical protein